MKSHRIPKFLTNPWKTKNGKFKTFSFKDNRIYEENANYFFAKHNILTQQEEEFWNKHVETPLADFFNRIPDTLKTVKKIENWKHIKAMYLLLISIIERSSQNNSGRKCSHFDDKDLDAGMWHWHQKNNLLILNTPDRLMFPEFGFFPIVFLTKEKKPLGVLGVPILGNKVLITFNRQIDSKDIIEYVRKPEFLMTASISNVGNKVISTLIFLKKRVKKKFLKYCLKRENFI